ncbi:MAG: PadR family transcriptional regulator [Clostridiales bacterium]|nr:PadR family transcriptional regulator [Clostridiales bacterium]
MIYIILGLLMLKPLTIYEMSRILQGKVSPFYSGSYGSIQAALKKLTEQLDIASESIIENGRNKKKYSITKSGKEQFMNWLETDFLIDNFKNDALTKVFFFGFLEKSKQVSSISNYLTSLEETLIDYKNHKAYKRTIPIELEKVAFYQYQTLEYGIFQIESEIEFYKKLLKEVKHENFEEERL